MKSTVQKLPNCKATLTVEVSQEQKSAARDAAVNYYARHAKISGFRPGKAPKSVIEKRFAQEIEGALMQQLADDALKQSVKENNLQVLQVMNAQPKPPTESGDLVFEYELSLRPEFTLPNYKGLKVELERPIITDKLVTKIIDRQREQFAVIKDVEARVCKMGDYVVVDYSGKIDGQPMKEIVPESESFVAENSGFLLKLESENFLPGFCEQIAGFSPGETRIVVAKIPDNEGINEAIRGREAVYEVSIKAVKEQEIPEMNDELASRMIPGKNVEEVRQEVRARIEADAKNREETEKKAKVIAALRDSVEFEVPQSVVNHAAQRRVNELVQMNLRRGLEEDVIKENEGALVEAATAQAKLDVKDEFLLNQIAIEEKITVSKDEIDLRIAQIAARARTTTKQVLKVLKKDEGLDNLRYRIMLDKAVDLLMENAEITVSEKEITGDEEEE